MKTLYYNKEEKVFTLQLTQLEIENLILYLGHGRHAKGLDALNYDDIGWTESAKIARKIRDEIDTQMRELNNILNIENHGTQD